MQAGAVLGPYRIERELGSGGMGRVYAAVAEERTPGIAAGTRVALKVVHPHLLDAPGFFKRFVREARIGQAIEHENVVRTLDCDATKDAHFLVMEHVEGQTLRSLLDELGRLPEELCRHVGREVARGLGAIHEAGVVHRDVKPENIIIALSGAMDGAMDRAVNGAVGDENAHPRHDHIVKVMDLGVAQLREEAVRLSATGAFVGSIHYAAPEQFSRGKDAVDARADLYALGLVLYELSTGRHPIAERSFPKVMHDVLHTEPPRVAALNPKLSPFFEEVVHRLLAKDPSGRFASAADVHRVLEHGERSTWWREHARKLRTTTNRPLRRMRIPRETALYGRDEDLAKLRAGYEQAKRGDGRVILIDGEAGVGKSRLVDEFVGQLVGGDADGREDLNFLFGSYPPGGAATAAGAFSTAYREHFGSHGLESTLARYLPDYPLLIPAFAAALRGEPTPRDELLLNKDSLQTVFVQSTHALAEERPTVVLIDDLHFTPPEGLALFAALALAVPGHRVLLVGTTRRGLSEEWTANVERQEHATRMTLSRLGPKDLFRLLEDSFRSKPLANELAGQIAVKSDGNPFFAFEIIRGLREGRLIEQSSDGTWVSTSEIKRIEVPSSVTDLIRARISVLTDPERELLDVASCCGFEFDPVLVAAAAGSAPIPALRTFGRVEAKHRLVHSAGRRFVFDHHQVQEALYDGLAVHLREHYHTAIAEALEARADSRDGEILHRLCEHHLSGIEPARALRYLDDALTHLEEGHLNEQAVELAARALEGGAHLAGAARIDALLRQAGILGLIARRPEQRAALDEALALARDDGNDDANDDGGDDGEIGKLAHVEVALGQHLLRTSRHDEARETLTTARDHARAAGETAVESRAEGHLGYIAFGRGDYDAARAHHERARELAVRIDDVGGQLRATGNLGTIHWAEGRLDEARAAYEQCLALAIETGDRAQEAIATGNLGNVYSAQARYDEAIAQHTRRLELARQVGDRRAQALAHHNLGGPLARLGALDEAARHLERSVTLSREVDDHRLVSWGEWMLGEIADWSGRDSDAERLYAAAVATMREQNDRLGLVPTLNAYGAFLARTGNKPAARRHLAEAVQIARATGRPGSAVYALARLALLGDGGATTVRAALTEHSDQVAGADRIDIHFHLWQLDADPADLTAAHDLLQETLATTAPRHHAEMLANVPLYRDITTAVRERGIG